MQIDSILHRTGLQNFTVVKENDEYNFKIVVCETSDGQKLLITDGLRNRNQAVNKNNADLINIELYMAFPKYWNLSERNWPIEWLNRIAQVPQKNDTWFGVGDTIPAGNPPEELDPKFKANHFVLSRPISHRDLFPIEETHSSGVQMLAVIPIFQQEMDYKLKNSHTMLFNKMAKKGVTEQVDLFRENTCKVRFFGMFG